MSPRPVSPEHFRTIDGDDGLQQFLADFAFATERESVMKALSAIAATTQMAAIAPKLPRANQSALKVVAACSSAFWHVVDRAGGYRSGSPKR